MATSLIAMMYSCVSGVYSQADVCRPNTFNETVTGTDLFCFDCTETYVKSYDPDDSPCWNNLSQIALRQCGPRDKYCKVGQPLRVT